MHEFTAEIKKLKDVNGAYVEIPEDFQSDLDKNAAAKDFYLKLSFSDKKRFVQWIVGAKKAETRITRIEKAILMLEDNQKLK